MDVRKVLESELKRCDMIQNREDRKKCFINLMKVLTEFQDYANIHLLTEDLTDKTLASLVNNANAIILHISKRDYNPDALDLAYLKEKADKIGWKVLSIRFERGL